MCDNVCVCVRVTEATPFIIGLLLDLCLDLGSDLLQVHRRLGRLTFLLRHCLSTALFEMGKSSEDGTTSQHLHSQRAASRLPRCHAQANARERKNFL